MNLKEDFYRKLKNDKIKINWNKNPIKMELFLSFLTVDFEISRNHLGSSTGWTLQINKECNLEISGGFVDRIEYLDNLKYGENLDNPYNNFVNPFYLFEILTKEGQKFFLDYYKADIDKIVKDHKVGISILSKRIKEARILKSEILNEIEMLQSNCT